MGIQRLIRRALPALLVLGLAGPGHAQDAAPEKVTDLPAIQLPVKAAPAPSKAAPTDPGTKPTPRLLTVSHVKDTELLAVVERWRKALSELDMRSAETAQRELLTLKDDLGIENMDGVSLTFLRAAEARRDAHDSNGAVALATAAVQLAPGLPYGHFALAEALLWNSPFALGSELGEIRAGLAALWSDPRFARPALADLGTSLVLALTGTLLALVGVLFFRRVGYFLHDVHHLFPRSAARWQSAALAMLLLSLPLLFRLGLVPVLLTLLAALALYLTSAERLLVGALLALACWVPLGGGMIARNAAFAGTNAEDVYLLERGGLEAKDAVARTQRKVTEDKSQYQDLFALARYEGRRGELDDAIAHYQQAAERRTNDPRLLTNLANAFFARGDLDNAADLYTSASQADPTLAAPLFNVGKLYARRATTVSEDLVGMEVDRAQTALAAAQRLDESLMKRPDPPGEEPNANRLLLSPRLPREDLVALADAENTGERVTLELGSRFLGNVDPKFATPVALLGVALVVLLGFLRTRGKFARPCEQCGRPVCRRCDPELSSLGKQCNQCVHLFGRTAAVAGPERVRKQLEIRRHETRNQRTAYLLGALVSGTGQVVTGSVLRGGGYLFLFVFAAVELFLRHGVLRAPYGPAPLWLRTAPSALLLLYVYVHSLRGLRKPAVVAE